MMYAVYYENAFEIDGEIYIVNPKNGMIQCATGETPNGTRMDQISEAIYECKKERKETQEARKKELERARHLIEEIEEINKHLGWHFK